MRFSLLGVLVVSLISACLSGAIDIKPEDDGTPSTTVVKLNMNVEGLTALANAYMKADSIAIFNLEFNDDGSVLYWLSMKNGGDIDLYSEIISDEFRVPELSMKREGNVFYWTVNGVYLTDQNGNRISVTDSDNPVSFIWRGNTIHCRVKRTTVAEYPATKAGYMAKDVSTEYNSDRRAFDFHFSSGDSISLPTISSFQLLDLEVPNRSFYKDVFLDAGIVLTSRKSLAAATYLGLSLEGISLPYSNPSKEDVALQTAIMTGEPIDLNGRLLYPDGQPRYRLLFVNGGTPTSHGSYLGEGGLGNMRAFVENGGCYVGTCAGAMLAANGYDEYRDYRSFLSIWPGIMLQSKVINVHLGMFIDEGSPLLRYFDFGGDNYVSDIRHNNGGVPLELVPGTEVLARYDYPKNSILHNQPSILAYKRTPKTGRVIMEGSHPEEVKDGERRDLTAAMMLYAIDGVGVTTLKGYLKNGDVRVMDKLSTDKNPAYTRIGDLQTHHFAVYIPSDAKNVRVEVYSPCDCDLALMMNQGTYAFSDVAEYRSAVPGAKQQLSFQSIREGFWFIAVQCLTTVTVTDTSYGQEYGGNLDVLNGMPYQISISWE